MGAILILFGMVLGFFFILLPMSEMQSGARSVSIRTFGILLCLMFLSNGFLYIVLGRSYVEKMFDASEWTPEFRFNFYVLVAVTIALTFAIEYGIANAGSVRRR